MKQIAQDYIGKEVTDAIVTYPAYFIDLLIYFWIFYFFTSNN